MSPIKDIVIFTSQLFREGDVIVSYCPELDISSFGETPDEAKTSLVEAISVFLEECQRMGTLHDVLEEAGYRVSSSDGHRKWTPPVPLAIEQLDVTVA